MLGRRRSRRAKKTITAARKRKRRDSMLISCIMPTYNRREFIPQALKYFERQDYPYKELIIVDDGTDTIIDLLPTHLQITYIMLSERCTLGMKCNIACSLAKGEVICHFDDDDYFAPHR